MNEISLTAITRMADLFDIGVSRETACGFGRIIANGDKAPWTENENQFRQDGFTLNAFPRGVRSVRERIAWLVRMKMERHSTETPERQPKRACSK